MAKSNSYSPNFAAGELSPYMHGRVELPVAQRGVAKMENFIVRPQGAAQRRPGTYFVNYTRQNKIARLIPFQFSDAQAYIIEATDKKFRFYKDEAVITEAAKTITDIDADGTITSAAHAFADGDEIFIDAIVGPDELNGQFFVIADATTDTFTLTDVFGEPVSLADMAEYVSGGTAARIYEIDTPYAEADLFDLQYAQNADTMYVVSRNYKPRKVTRTGHAAWTCDTYTLTADPFVPTTKTINGISTANPAVLTTSAAHGYAVGDYIYITGTGTPTNVVDSVWVIKSVPSTTTFTMEDQSGTAYDGTGITFLTNKTATRLDEYPGAVCFISSGRLLMGSTRLAPDTIWGSRSPQSGVTDYDDFTIGTQPTSAFKFPLASTSNGKVDVIQWLAENSKFIIAGCYGSSRIIYGNSVSEAVTPLAFQAKSINGAGAAKQLPVIEGADCFFVQRNRKQVRSLDYDFTQDGYDTPDRNLVSEHLPNPGIKQIAMQSGRPDIIWCVLDNGRLVAMTYNKKEDIQAWHRHYIGGSHVDSNSLTRPWGKVLSVGIMARDTESEQVWFSVERKIGVNTVRSVEFISDFVVFPLRNEYVTEVGEDDDPVEIEIADDETFENVLYEAQKEELHVDMALAFDATSENPITVFNVLRQSGGVGSDGVNSDLGALSIWAKAYNWDEFYQVNSRDLHTQASFDEPNEDDFFEFKGLAVDANRGVAYSLRIKAADPADATMILVSKETVADRTGFDDEYELAPGAELELTGYYHTVNGATVPLALTKNGQYLYVAAYNSGATEVQILKVETLTGNVVQLTGAFTEYLEGIILSPDDTRVYAVFEDYVRVFNTNGMSTIFNHNWTTGSILHFDLSPDGDKLVWSAQNNTNNYVYILDTSAFTVSSFSFASTSNGCGGIAVNEDSDHVYIAPTQSSLRGTVRKYDLTGSLIDTYDLGLNLQGSTQATIDIDMLRVEPDSGLIFGLNNGANYGTVFCFNPSFETLVTEKKVSSNDASVSCLYLDRTTVS